MGVEAPGGFSSSADEQQAAHDAQQSELVFNAVKWAFEHARKTDCDNGDLTAQLERLHAVEALADHYVDKAATSAPADSEEAMDVADELLGFSLDGYLAAAEGYRTMGCPARAWFLYSEVIRVYTGDRYARWRREAQMQLAMMPPPPPPPPPARAISSRHPVKRPAKAGKRGKTISARRASSTTIHSTP